MPERIQRKRAAGWKMPENTVSVTRPGRWGNPFAIGGWFTIGRGRGFAGMIWCRAVDEAHAGPGYVKVEDAAHAVEMYRTFLRRYPLTDKQVVELRGKNLACFCKLGAPCHADVLLEVANG